MQHAGFIHVNDDIGKVMSSMGFSEETCHIFQIKYANTDQRVISFWNDSDGEEYATLDLCVEIPMRCCRPVAHGD